MQILNLKNYQIVLGEDEIWTTIKNVLHQSDIYSSILVLVDENTKEHCLPVFQKNVAHPNLRILEIPSGEINKNLDTCQRIWTLLMEQQADRKSLLINLGGGVIGDMGGFAAGTYKRGFDFIQIPTTLLAMVDASIGGKLGVDFNNIKNSIGLFLNPQVVFIYPPFLESLPDRELRSGFAEVIKHALIADHGMWMGIQEIKKLERVKWKELIIRSLKIKQQIVEQDPYEKGLRKVLNFGHTIGHAIESHSLTTSEPLLHGEAIAVGMICEAYLSSKSFVLSQNAVNRIAKYIIQIYGKSHIDSRSFDKLLDLMAQDKKNEFGKINFSLLKEEGVAVFNQTCDASLIRESLVYYQGL